MMKKTKLLGASIIFILILAMNVFAGSWQRDQHGWWYRFDNGSYPASKWEMINGSWYHFNSYGYMETGWINDGGTWYYCYGDGSMAHDTWVDGTYYVGSTGEMYVNATTPDGFKVGADGTKKKSSGMTEDEAVIIAWNKENDDNIASVSELTESGIGYVVDYDAANRRYWVKFVDIEIMKQGGSGTIIWTYVYTDTGKTGRK